ncbi:TRAP transporter substrate-binding protein DctP [Pelagibacterium lentulum]|uniref:C4-dicarboxylate ABC transporter n=1 Tax=Pelagibacterium lentulum TaxID=2029865 RepID=A0A916VXN9_9HYPH|nr:TRAP transporter substrate-binding protein DctP [Pelagibacterium lentulum]GGA49758.1 C4-dicarboxylate ABC transporter [Pelagibacterium lentulum]
MSFAFTRRGLMASAAGLALSAAVAGTALPAFADTVTLRMSAVQTPTDVRSVVIEEIFAPAIADFATYEPHYNGTLFRQGTELEAIARGNLEMSITSAQELSNYFPEWSMFTSGYLMRDGRHQINVFQSDIGEEMYQIVEDAMGIKLLTVIYLGQRHVNLRGDREVTTPEDLSGVILRMPDADSWQFLGRALGANPVPMAFGEVYTALQTGAIDGQDNPLPTVRDSRFYEVTDQIVLTSHLVDMNFLSISADVWNSFTPEQQDVMQQAAYDAAEEIYVRQSGLENELATYFESQGLRVYTPDVDAFRSHVQALYLDSQYAQDWPEGMVDRVNAVPGEE